MNELQPKSGHGRFQFELQAWFYLVVIVALACQSVRTQWNERKRWRPSRQGSQATSVYSLRLGLVEQEPDCAGHDE
jgi:hypothetical protein